MPDFDKVVREVRRAGGGINNTILLQDCILRNSSAAAVILLAGGYYSGKRTEFHDNYNGLSAIVNSEIFTHVDEQYSNFHDNVGNPISLQNVSEIRLIGDTILSESSNGSGISISGGNGITEIEGNVITGSNDVRFGLSVILRKYTSIVDNTITGIGATDPNNSHGIFVGGIDDVTIENNTVYDNINSSGITISGCPGSQVTSNNVTGHTTNLSLSLSDNSTLESNICSYATFRNIFAGISMKTTLCNNNCNNSEDGITFTGNMALLEMNYNAMIHCERGLVYKNDVFAGPQIAKGNYFLLNTLGAEFENTTDPVIIDAMRYEVRDLPTEYPSFTPSGWFLPTATTALNCNPITTLPPIEYIPELRRLIDGINDVSPDGKVMHDFMIALELIEAESDFLEDEDIYDFYEVYEGTDLDLLLTIQNISNQRILFPESTPVIEVDEEGVLDADLTSHLEYLDGMETDYDEVVTAQETAINTAIEDMEELEPANIYEEKYQFAILQYLGILAGESLTNQNVMDIIELAEGCLADDGPGVYVAQFVADIQGLSYTQATGCTPVTQRSYTSKNNINESAPIKVFPNPANEHLKLSSHLNNESIYIYDLVGKVGLHESNVNSNQINISNLIPGIYHLHIVGRNEKVPFVKL